MERYPIITSLLVIFSFKHSRIKVKKEINKLGKNGENASVTTKIARTI